MQYLRIDFPRRSKFWFVKPDHQGIKKGKEYTQPLSWKLTASQKYALEEAWRGIIPTTLHLPISSVFGMEIGDVLSPQQTINKKNSVVIYN